MNAAKQAGWLFCVMIALACSGWYFASSAPSAQLDEQTLATTADSVVAGLTVRRFDATGSLANFLESPEMQHIPDKDTNVFKSPHIILAQENQAPWDIRAKKALSLTKGEHITLLGNVVIHQAKDAHTEESTFKTEELLYLPKQKFATTTLAVQFEQAGSIVNSTGMKAYLDDKHVELLGKTHAIYEPHHA